MKLQHARLGVCEFPPSCIASPSPASCPLTCEQTLQQLHHLHLQCCDGELLSDFQTSSLTVMNMSTDTGMLRPAHR